MKNIPRTFYIFCNQLNPVTYHNLRYAKSFSSAGFTQAGFDEISRQRYQDGTATYLPFAKAEPTIQTMSPYLLTAMNEYRVEYDAEQVRLRYFPKLPSRLSAVFAFGTMESCREVSEKWSWNLNSVKRFELVPHELNRVTKANMEVVSLARGAYKSASWDVSQIESIWRHYWSGQAELQLDIPARQGREVTASGIIWEYLIEGQVRLID